MPENLPTDENYEAALDEAVGEALEGDLRTAEWRQLISALRRRQAMLQNELESIEANDENLAARQKLEDELRQTNEHIAVLQEEENITRFIEESVRFSAEVRRLQQG